MLYFRETSYWQPGQTIPVSDHEFHPEPASRIDQTDSVIADVLQGFQVNIEKQLSLICGKLETIDDRMNQLESQQRSIQDEIRATVPQPANLKSADSLKTRTRVTPTSLQVRE